MIFSTFAFFKIKTKSECGFEKWFCLMKQTERKLNVCFQYSMNREEKVSLGFVYHTDEESREFLVLLEGCPHKWRIFVCTFKKWVLKNHTAFITQLKKLVWLRSFVCHICCPWKILQVEQIWILHFSRGLYDVDDSMVKSVFLQSL